MAAMTHTDFGGCEDHTKTIHQAYVFLNDKEAGDINDQWGPENAVEQLSRKKTAERIN